MISPLHARWPDVAGDAASSAGTQSWSGLHGVSLALALQSAASKVDRPLLVVMRSSRQAQLLADDLRLVASGAVPVLAFPDHETLPYDPFSPHPDIIAERLGTLSRLPGLRQGLVLCSIGALSQRLPPVSFVGAGTAELVTGQKLDTEAFRSSLLANGYQTTEHVFQAGQFAIRGSLFDLWPSGLQQPIRIDLFDDEIDSIRLFDPESQRSSDSLQCVQLLPAREYPSDGDALDAFRRAFRLRFDVDTRAVPLYQDIRTGLHPQGLEQYLPLFFETLASLFDYLPGNCEVAVQIGADQALETEQQRTRERWEQRRHDIERPVLEPDELFLPADQCMQQINERLRVTLPDPAANDPVPRFNSSPAPALPLHESGKQGGDALTEFVRTFRGQILFAADSPGRREMLSGSLAAFGVKPAQFEDFGAFRQSAAHLGLTVLPVSQGCLVPDELAVITESELFGGRARQRSRRESGERDPEAIIRNLNDLLPGAPVVHEDHGVGRYQGLEVLEIDGQPAEFLTLSYADDDRLYVPVSYLHLVSRYTGSDPDSAPLHRLGSKQWETAKRKAAEKIRDVAAELLDLYARREAREGFAFPLDARLYAEFVAGFPYEETPDQQSAIDAVTADLQSARPMDRVVCGDVGFGKTEVALRAAFIAVQAGKQVALLVPTTLLAQQHYNTFADRLADWPVRLDLLSRFRSGKQTSEALQRLAEGHTDVVIGTHRLLSRDIRFKRLGLLIIDEEHRFGVQQKERLKQLRAEVDVLTLTATPIPRTLNMALSGIRELSIIATPPARRMAVKTLITPWDKAVIREALYRELQRGGQVFFLHNEVRSIERIAGEVQELIPEARLAVAHGQMPERQLEQVMLDFYRQRTNVLVCSTIIESGIDVPTANTIIINRADRFGLAQLHQLRGRVGRSHHRAYAYLVVPDQRSMTADGRKRLEAIASLEELGAGFTLATHDMEIRGAGELLGAEQSGQIHEIGFSLYSDMLNRTVEALRRGEQPELDQPLHRGIEIELHLAALIPDTYLPDVQARLVLYKRIASANDAEALRDLQVEMIDRFGLLPTPVKNLFELAGLRQLAERVGLRRIDYGPHGGRIEFAPDTRADPARLIRLIQEHSELYRLDGPDRLRFLHGEDAPEQRIATIQALLHDLLPDA